MKQAFQYSKQMACPKTRRKSKKLVKIAVKHSANSQMSCLIVKGTPLKTKYFAANGVKSMPLRRY